MCKVPVVSAFIVVSLAACGDGETNSARADASPAATPDAAAVPPDAGPDPALYYLDSYIEARAAFRDLADALLVDTPAGSLSQIALVGDDDLTVDLLYLPADDPERLLVVTSGVHGMEAFAGSALQRMMLAEFDLDRPGLSVLFVHAVNPWGFHNRRRGDETNADLNRNLAVDDSLFATVNLPYRELNEGLNPTTAVTQADLNGAIVNIVEVAMQVPRAELQQAITQGQYEFEQGLYFGGSAFAEQKAPLEAVLRQHVAAHRAVMLLDLHTGFGVRGELQLFGTPELGDQAAQDTVFDGFEVDLGQDPDAFYETTGDMPQYLGALADQEGVLFIGMTIEYGTMDSQTDVGAVLSLANLVLENQGFHHGYENQNVQDAVEDKFAEMFFPTASTWRDQVIVDSRAQLSVFVERFAVLPIPASVSPR